MPRSFGREAKGDGSHLRARIKLRRLNAGGPWRTSRSRPKSAGELQTLAYELAVAESRERERIARGLHDVIGQVLAMARFKLGELREATESVARAALVDELGDLLAQAARATRSTTFELSCSALQFGLQPALEGLAKHIERESDLVARVDGQLPPLSIPEPVLAVLFRAVRELGLNVQKHAKARRMWFALRCRKNQLEISVSDDGVGFEHVSLARGFDGDGGFGLFSVEAQMKAIGGRLALRASPGRGTVATVSLLLPSSWLNPGQAEAESGEVLRAT